MITPDVVVCSVGSEIYWRHPTGYFLLDETWERVLDLNWDRNTLVQLVQELGIDQLVLQVMKFTSHWSALRPGTK